MIPLLRALQELKPIDAFNVMAEMLGDENDPYFQCKNDDEKFLQLPISIRAYVARRVTSESECEHPKGGKNLGTYYDEVLRMLKYPYGKYDRMCNFVNYHVECIFGPNGSLLSWKNDVFKLEKFLHELSNYNVDINIVRVEIDNFVSTRLTSEISAKLKTRRTKKWYCRIFAKVPGC